MAGGVAFETPFGKIYSTNLTPDEETGIGKWTEKDFAQALRKGVRPDGAHLYPVFPFTAYTKVTDTDAAALFAYLKSLPAVSSAPPANEMSFPFNQRRLMSIWKALFFDEGAYQPVAGQSDEWNRGAYLVEGLGHCSACHSPRNFLGAERSSAAMTGGTYLDRVPTGELRPWSAPNLTSAANGLGEWSVEDIAAYLKTGANDHVSVSGP
jgi:mono/diheme cytochrome c family protein